MEIRLPSAPISTPSRASNPKNCGRSTVTWIARRNGAVRNAAVDHPRSGWNDCRAAAGHVACSRNRARAAAGDAGDSRSTGARRTRRSDDADTGRAVHDSGNAGGSGAGDHRAGAADDRAACGRTAGTDAAADRRRGGAIR